MLTFEKLSRRAPEIIAAASRATQPFEEVWTCVAPGRRHDNAMSPPPPDDDPRWIPLRQRQLWGGEPGADLNAAPVSVGWGIPTNGGGNHWLRTRLQVPEEWRGKQVLLELDWERG